MTIATDALIAALRLRYDHYSAQSMLEVACERAGLAEKAAYDETEVRALRTALVTVGDRLDGVLARIDVLLADAPDAPAAPAPAKSPSKAPVEAKPVTDTKGPVETKPAAAEAVESKAAPLETTIVLTGVEVSKGEEVLVCGGLPALGDWDPERARPMARKGDAWSTTVAVTPGAEIAFKFLRRMPDGEVIWEGGANRSLDAQPRIEATWR